MIPTEEELNELKPEAIELLDAAEESLLHLDDGSDFQECFDSIFRAFHNIKGGAGALKFDALQAHMHQLETILTACRTREELSKEKIDLFLRGIDAARLILNGQYVEFACTVPTSPLNYTAPVGSPSGTEPSVAPLGELFTRAVELAIFRYADLDAFMSLNGPRELRDELRARTESLVADWNALKTKGQLG